MKKILIIDDYRTGADSLAKLLMVLGHDARVAYDGLRGLQLAMAWKPDVIFVDLLMPDLDGFDVVAKLRARPETKNALLIALTGVGAPEMMTAATDAGFDHYMEKPATANSLVKVISGRAVH